jgi:hypothetical protein
MRVEVSVDSEDIQRFFNTYMSQALPSALCKRLVAAIQYSIPNDDDEYRYYLLDFLSKIEALEITQRKIEDDMF